MKFTNVTFQISDADLRVTITACINGRNVTDTLVKKEIVDNGDLSEEIAKLRRYAKERAKKNECAFVERDLRGAK